MAQDIVLSGHHYQSKNAIELLCARLVRYPFPQGVYLLWYYFYCSISAENYIVGAENEFPVENGFSRKHRWSDGRMG